MQLTYFDISEPKIVRNQAPLTKLGKCKNALKIENFLNPKCIVLAAYFAMTDLQNRTK